MRRHVSLVGAVRAGLTCLFLLFMICGLALAEDQAIIKAIYKNDVEGVKTLLKQDKTVVGVRDANFNTPLHVAAENGAFEICMLLLESGADVNAKNMVGATPLCLVMKKGWVNVATLLLDHHADPSMQDDEGQQPLHYAGYSGYRSVAGLLLKHGTDINAKDFKGNTPLQACLLHGRPDDYQLDFMKFLFENGADVTLTNEDGMSPLHTALANRCRVEVLSLLLARKEIDINGRDDEGETPLHHAIISGYPVSVIQTLLDKGAQVNLQDDGLRAPLRAQPKISERFANLKSAHAA
jgi:ankyrin repeat protein